LLARRVAVVGVSRLFVDVVVFMIVVRDRKRGRLVVVVGGIFVIGVR
jgi:hypothetical protein